MRALFILLLTTCRHRGMRREICGVGPTPRGWSRPRKRTTDQGRFLTEPDENRLSQLRAQGRIFAGFPLNRPRSAKAPREATADGRHLVEGDASGAVAGLSNWVRSDYWGRMTSNHARLTAF